MQARILICIPIFNRIPIAEQCIQTILSSMYAGDHLALYDDGCDEDVLRLLGGASNATHHVNLSDGKKLNLGVDAQRRRHIIDFRGQSEFTHLYFSDADAFVDPHWRERLLDIQARTGLLTCGYHTQTHENYEKNVYNRDGDILFTRFAPGVSYLLERRHVEKIGSLMPDRWNFDWHIPGILGYKCAVSDVSCVDHLGAGGMHDTSEPGCVSRERATNPTPWLIQKRAEILANLGLRES